MRLYIRHTTRYGFSQPVTHGLQRLRLTPKSSQGQSVIDWAMDFEGVKLEAEHDDHHRNRTTLVSVVPGTTAVTVVCSGSVDTAENADKAGIVGEHVGHLPLWCFLGQTTLTKPGPRLRALVAGLDADRERPLEVLHRLSDAVLAAVPYATGATDAETTAEGALFAGQGVCQDHTHIFIGAARLLGLPARYVSGYLMMDGRVDQEAGHGWAEAHVAGLGWVGFDVSNAICPDERYVRLATGTDYRDAAPVTGLNIGGGQIDLEVSLAVEQQMIEQ
ncbi:transglutaminase family protein [Novosphingobium sp. G106]|uniref:transglutaminase family protein n=1 Tax=Novosphingobium sp. G106 TaxID=2849500 RepID=UPI001C2D355D|nr:transglutaminase family protein [Novosphingobium sp. G106]MBV1690984.1 transglutaminase family protein [Novosphingobium sp. G106]